MESCTWNHVHGIMYMESREGTKCSIKHNSAQCSDMILKKTNSLKDKTVFICKSMFLALYTH